MSPRVLLHRGSKALLVTPALMEIVSFRRTASAGAPCRGSSVNVPGGKPHLLAAQTSIDKSPSHRARLAHGRPVGIVTRLVERPSRTHSGLTLFTSPDGFTNARRKPA